MSVILELFFTFLKIGMFSIGGGYAIIPLIREQVVAQSGWIGEQTFTDIITISQMTPGPLAVNTSTFVGLQIGGITGAAAATAGCILCGVTVSLALYRFFQRYRRSAYVFEILGGLKAASLGLIVSAAATILMLTFFGTASLGPGLPHADPDLTALAMFFISMFALRRWKINPMVIMAASGVTGIFLYRL